jgi:hypothetical protein
VSFLPTSFQHSQAIRQTKQIQGVLIGKEKFKWSLIADEIILKPLKTLKDLKNSTKNLLELIKTFNNVAGYKNHYTKSLAYLYTNNEKSEKEIRKTISLTIASTY